MWVVTGCMMPVAGNRFINRHFDPAPGLAGTGEKSAYSG
jgi:hypothetical protein